MLGPGLDQAAGYARAEKSAVTRRAARVDRWAAEHEVSRSEAVRLLIERGLKK